MQFGIFLNTQAPPDGRELPRVYDELLETVVVAEEAGFDWCFLPEHHQQPDGYLPSPFVMAGAIASATSRIGISTGIHVLPLWHPLRVAEDAAVVDNLAPGRFMLGVGLGLVEAEFRQFGVELTSAVSRFEEQVEILREAWKPDPLRFTGRHFDFDGIPVTPKPVSEIPLLLGGMSDKAVARAGRLGDGWLSDPLHSFQALTGWADLYRRTASQASRQPHLWIQRDCWVSPDPREVREVWAPHLVSDWQFYFNIGLFSSGRFNPEAEPWIRDVTHASEITFDRLHEDRVLAGDADSILAAIQSAYERLGMTGLALRMRYPHGPDHTATLRSIRAFGENVLQPLSLRLRACS